MTALARREPLRNLASRLLIPRDEWVAAFRWKALRRTFALAVTLLLVSNAFRIVSGPGGAADKILQGVICAGLAGMLVDGARNGFRVTMVVGPLCGLAAATSSVEAIYEALLANTKPLDTLAGITGWTPLVFMVSAGCLRPLGARLLNGVTALAISTLVAIWLLSPASADATHREQTMVLMTFPLLVTCLLIQEATFAMRERNAGRRAADRQSRVDRRRRAAAEAELQRAREDLLRLNRVSVVNTMARALSADIGEPLQAVTRLGQSAADALATAPADVDRAISMLGEAHDHAQQAVEIVESVRALTRRRPADLAAAPVAPLVRDVVRLVERDGAARGIDVRMDLPADMGAVWSRGVQLQQLLLNLLNDAIERLGGRDGGGLIRIHADRPQPEQVRLCVVDNGTSIPADALAQADRGLPMDDAEDPGLAIAICRQIVHAHGGSIAFESGAAGTTVTVLLPAPAALADDGRAAA